MYEAKLKSSTSRKSITFKYFVFMNCVEQIGIEELTDPLENIAHEF